MRYVVFSLLALLLVPTRSSAQGFLTGRVRQAGTGTPLGGAVVSVGGTSRIAATTSDGRFTLPAIPAGTWSVIVRRIGYRPDTLPGIVLRAESTTVVVADLVAVRRALDTVVVLSSPSVAHGSRMAGIRPAAVMSSADVLDGSQIVPDAFHAASRVAGVSSDDFSAGFRVRGGPDREVLLTLDGVQLYEPFHLKDMDGALSIIDPEIVGTATLSTGGFGARYGNHVTGVFDIRSRDEVPVRGRGTVSASVGGLTGLYEAPAIGGRSDWLVSVRRGFLGPELALAGQGHDLVPSYFDAFARLRLRADSANAVSVGVLAARDRTSYAAPDEPSLASAYGSTYGWITWNTHRSSGVSGRSTLSLASLDWLRNGSQSQQGTPLLGVVDHRSFAALGLDEDWSVPLGSRADLAFGAEARRVDATYDYQRSQVQATVVSGRWVQREVDATASPTPQGATFGAYSSLRVRPTSALMLDAGLRYDRESYIPGRTLDPRAALAYAIGPSTTVHAAWGRYSQAQELYELQVQDGDRQFGPAERAEQRQIDVDQRLGAGLTMTVAAYDRRLLRLAPQYVSLETSFSAFPEIGDDRVFLDPSSGDARGVEVSATLDRGPLHWSASYALASTRQTVDGHEIPMAYDQRHSLFVEASVRPSPAWTVSAEWRYHSGWPATPVQFVVDSLSDGTYHVRQQFGEYNATRLGSYNRLDVSVTHRLQLAGGVLSAYANVFNVLGRDNPRGLAFLVPDWNTAQPTIVPAPRTQLPRMPTVGARWDF